MMNNGGAVRITGLTVDRGRRRVLEVADLTVPRGSITGLLGPSGSGKTTLMRAIVGVQRVRGTVEVLGLPAGAPALRSRVGYVTQAPSVYSDLTVRENLRYFAAVLGAGRADIDRVAAEVGLVDRIDQLVGEMSGGERARVSLAAALLGRPELLVLDEPTVGLDPVLRRSLWRLFARLAAEGATLLVSSHVMDEAARCDHLILLREGRLLAAEPRVDLLARTGTSDVEEAFLRLVAEPDVPSPPIPAQEGARS
jgi:ABC-2 type transport system ATP-binding protein